MLQLEQLEKDTLVEGIEPDGPVRIVDADLVSEDAAEVFYVKVSDGKSNVTMLYRSDGFSTGCIRTGPRWRSSSAPGACCGSWRRLSTSCGGGRMGR